MHSFIAVARKWGNSVGVIVPSESNIKPGEQIILSVQRVKGAARARNLFGKLGAKTDGQKNVEEIDWGFEG
ncbi:hypothetical protein HY993_00480 [Candidatus Micrarchaeota archaeon]|nr:hypothetical protein [Candidatus Micrarchaeota archaeon]